MRVRSFALAAGVALGFVTVVAVVPASAASTAPTRVSGGCIGIDPIQGGPSGIVCPNGPVTVRPSPPPVIGCFVVNRHGRIIRRFRPGEHLGRGQHVVCFGG